MKKTKLTLLNCQLTAKYLYQLKGGSIQSGIILQARPPEDFENDTDSGFNGMVIPPPGGGGN